MAPPVKIELSPRCPACGGRRALDSVFLLKFGLLDWSLLICAGGIFVAAGELFGLEKARTVVFAAIGLLPLCFRWGRKLHCRTCGCEFVLDSSVARRG